MLNNYNNFFFLVKGCVTDHVDYDKPGGKWQLRSTSILPSYLQSLLSVCLWQEEKYLVLKRPDNKELGLATSKKIVVLCVSVKN